MASKDIDIKYIYRHDNGYSVFIENRDIKAPKLIKFDEKILRDTLKKYSECNKS